MPWKIPHTHYPVLSEPQWIPPKSEIPVGKCPAVVQRKKKVEPEADRSFKWFTKPKKVNEETRKLLCVEDICPKATTIPIPVALDRYPYRYSSAGPSSFGRTKKEQDLRRCLLRVQPLSLSTIDQHKNLRGMNPANVRQIEGMETSTLQGSLQMLKAPNADINYKENEFRAKPIPPGLCEPSRVPYSAHSEFDRYVIDRLHPNWQKDPMYRRRIMYYQRLREDDLDTTWDDEWYKDKKVGKPLRRTDALKLQP